MVLFGRAPQVPDDDYAPVSRADGDIQDDEDKPLRSHLDDVGEDDTAAQRELYALSRSLRRANTFLKIIIALLCVTIISVLSMNVPDSVRKLIKSASCSGEPLIKTPVPPIPIEKVLFEKHPLYSQRPNEMSNKAWDALLPPGRGFVYVPDWPKYDYEPGQNTSWGMIYSVALFHQMHCLGQLRRFSYLFLDAIVKGDAPKMKEIKHMFGELDHASHMNHCFDYLRQTIACAGDMAMEWPRTEPDGRRFAVDGWGIPHECKSWSHIQAYMDKNHFEHSWNTDIAPLVGSSG